MISRDNFFIIGKTVDNQFSFTETPIAIAAFSSKFKPNEHVDTHFSLGSGTHFGLNLPDGTYQILVFSDENNNQLFESTEVIGDTSITIDESVAPQKVMDRVEIILSEKQTISWVEPFSNPQPNLPQRSLFFPSGAIRQFDDPLFSKNMALLGMYDPATFLEYAPTTFFALEEDIPYKIPVVFVHGIDSSIRIFEPFVSQIDSSKFKAWFFYYPSGGDLSQLAATFHRIFLSGETVRIDKLGMVIVAHSMGGLVVREALNIYQNKPSENPIDLFISIASPFDGHPSAAKGEKLAPMVLPSWRDLNPESAFIQGLFRKPLPDSIEHHLLYAFDNPSTLKMNRNSDGVVPLSSQLRLEAQQQATAQQGFNSGHVEIMTNENTMNYVLDVLAKIDNYYPEPHLKVMKRGGYAIKLDDTYSPISKYVINNLGQYYMALTKGDLAPLDERQERLLQAISGDIAPESKIFADWIRFLANHPEIVEHQ
ncbi:hypothetical protein NBRC116494_21920 [Aurantivibrio plasticivorans]